MHRNNPLVSVILPLYNGRNFIETTTRSVLAQSYDNFELLVIDDGSCDDGTELLPTDSRIHLFSRQNAGVAAARNFGMEQARGEFFAFIDQDDYWYPEKLELQMDILLNNDTIGYVVTLMHNHLVDGTECPGWLKPEYLSEDPVGLIPSTLLVRRQVMNAVGMFDRQYINSSDADWFIRAQEAGFSREVIDRVLITRNIHADNCSHDNQVCKQELFAILRKKLKSNSQEQ